MRDLGELPSFAAVDDLSRSGGTLHGCNSNCPRRDGERRRNESAACDETKASRVD